MLHLVSEQFDSHWDGMEYGLLGPERIAQLEREDLDRYHRSILKTSRYCDSMDEGSRSKADEDVTMDQEAINGVLLQFRDETKSTMAELKSELSDIISLLRDLNNELEAAHYMPAVFPTVFPVNSDEGLYGNKDSLSLYPYIIEIGSGVNGSSWISRLITNMSKASTPNLSYRDDVLGVSETNSPSSPKLGFNPQVFDPGTLALFKQEAYGSELHCIISELFLVYSQMYGAFSFYSRMVIEFCGCLFEWERNRNDKIDWVLSLWNSHEFLSWTCSALLWNCNVAGYDIFINSNYISTLPNAVWINRPFAIFCVVALRQLRATFDQATTMIPNGHYMVLRHSDVYIRDVGLLIQRLRFVIFGKSILDLAIVEHPSCTNNNFGCQNATLQKVMHQNTLLSEGLKPTQIWARQSNSNELLIVGFNFNNPTLVDSGGDRKYAMSYSSVGEVVPPLFGKAHNTSVTAITGVISSLKHVQSDDAYGDWASFSKSLFEEAKSFRKLLCCCIWPLERLTNVLDLVTSFGSWIDLSPMRAEFSWDPGGLCAIFIYILEDKDVFKRVGNMIVAMEMIRNIRDSQIKVLIEDLLSPDAAFVDGLKGVDGLLMFMFYPSLSSWNLTRCAPHNSSEMPGSFIVALWLSKVPFYFNPDDHSLNRDVPIQVFIGEKVMFFVKIISCLILFSDGWIHSLDLAGIYGTWPCWLSPLKANFVYDPGIRAIFIYILEDKDVFKRVGRWIVMMEHISELKVTMPVPMNFGDDHFEAITLQQLGDEAYAFAQFSQLGVLNIATCESILFAPRLPSRYAVWLGKLLLSSPLQILYPRYGKLGWVRTSIVCPSWCTVEYEVAEYIVLEVKGSAHHILTEDMYAQQVPKDRIFVDRDMTVVNVGAEYYFYVISTMKSGVGWVDIIAERVILESSRKWGRLVGIVDDMNTESLGQDSTWEIIRSFKIAALGEQYGITVKLYILFAMAVTFL